MRTVPATCQFYHIRPGGMGQLIARHLSCFYDGCGGGQCQQVDIVDHLPEYILIPTSDQTPQQPPHHAQSEQQMDMEGPEADLDSQEVELDQVPPHRAQNGQTGDMRMGGQQNENRPLEPGLGFITRWERRRSKTTQERWRTLVKRRSM